MSGSMTISIICLIVLSIVFSIILGILAINKYRFFKKESKEKDFSTDRNDIKTKNKKEFKKLFEIYLIIFSANVLLVNVLVMIGFLTQI
ncbi:hypothetical protein EMELA_v1c03610 [Mesoplasma melaleucae]|uniref:Uncharacterized protein n=1 Tax=Mesoplasma melaleucae TaxID=81459 RepID=A0A2K8NZ57_9MOLU|nr:hypothetical protein [Mesoplasma melaleucae]ATZ17923.1 hypothetical protein EMELA_v1c03610 [Mesoplasma melaleucae]